MSLKICLSLLVIDPSPAYSQECKYIVNDDGKVNERFIVIDKKTYSYFPVDKAKNLVSDAASSKSYKSENELLRLQLKLKDQTIMEQQSSINILQLNRQQHIEPFLIRLSFETSEFGFVLVVMTAIGTFYITSQIPQGGNGG